MHAICGPLQTRPQLTLWVFCRVGGYARRGRSGACYVHMAANASFTNSHQMMDSDKMGMNDHIDVSKISLMSFIHILELMKFAKSGRNAQQHFCLFIFPTKDCHRQIVHVSWLYLSFSTLVNLEPEVEINTSLTSFFLVASKLGKKGCRFCELLKT